MDGLLEKIGIYEFFTTFVSGLIFVSIALYSGIPKELIFPAELDSSLGVYNFLIISYFLGLLLQGIGSIFDRKQKYFDLMHRARERYLYGECAFKDKNERAAFVPIVKDVLINKLDYSSETIRHDFVKFDNLRSEDDIDLKKDSSSKFIFNYCKNAFQFCIVTIEADNKNWKSELIGSQYGLYRSLMVGCVSMLFIHLSLLICESKNFLHVGYQFSARLMIVRFVAFIVLAVFFKTRAVDAAEYRVRTVLRHYKMLYYDKQH